MEGRWGSFKYNGWTSNAEEVMSKEEKSFVSRQPVVDAPELDLTPVRSTGAKRGGLAGPRPE